MCCCLLCLLRLSATVCDCLRLSAAGSYPKYADTRSRLHRYAGSSQLGRPCKSSRPRLSSSRPRQVAGPSCLLFTRTHTAYLGRSVHLSAIISGIINDCPSRIFDPSVGNITTYNKADISSYTQVSILRIIICVLCWVCKKQKQF